MDMVSAIRNNSRLDWCDPWVSKHRATRQRRRRRIKRIFAIGKVVSTSDDGSRVTVAYDEETERRFREADLDRAAGYVGAFMAIAGTLIGGYGDLVGKLLN